MKTHEQISREIGDALNEHPDLGSIEETPEEDRKPKRGGPRGPKPVEKVYLKEVREMLGITGYELSKITHTTAGNICLVENGKVNLSIKALKELCITMDVSADVILFGNSGILAQEINSELVELRLFKHNIEKVVNKG